MSKRNDIAQLHTWLAEHECPIVAMESTGVYWRPVYNILEGEVEVILVNTRHIKNVPGRKTDIENSRWLAGLLQHGLLRGSFIPAKEIRHRRGLSRSRRKNTEAIGDYKRRVHKLFESADIKIESSVSDLFSMTGRNLFSRPDLQFVRVKPDRCTGMRQGEACVIRFKSFIEVFTDSLKNIIDFSWPT